MRGPIQPENATANLSRNGNFVRSRKNQAGVNCTGCFVRFVEPRGNSTRFSAIGFSLKYPLLTGFLLVLETLKWLREYDPESILDTGKPCESLFKRQPHLAFEIGRQS
jgi:hypothetical protein